MTNNQRWKYWQQLFNLLHCSYFLWDQEKSDWSSVSAQAKPGARRKPHPERLQLRWRGSGGRCFFFVAVLLWLILWMSVSRHSSVVLACAHQDRPPLQTWARRPDEYGLPGSLVGTVKLEHAHLPIHDFVWVCVRPCAAVQGFYFTFIPLWNIYLKPIWYPCFGLDIFYWQMKAFSHTHCFLPCFDCFVSWDIILP